MSETYPLLTDFFTRYPHGTLDLRTFLYKDVIQEIQTLLNEKGFNAGEVDGIVGRNTLGALEKAKEVLYLQYPTLIGKTTFDKLLDYEPDRNILALPTDGAGVVTSLFNPKRRHPVTGRIRPHRGIDIGAERGTPVFSVGEGIVSWSVDFCREGDGACGGGFGNFVRIAHLNLPFSESVYAHLQTVAVRRGQPVKRGELIGTLGNTGISTGPHLHFETWTGRVAVDPLNYFESIV